MKKLLIYILACNKHPYPMLTQASLQTWDSYDIEGSETRYYSGHGVKVDHPKCIQFQVDDGYNGMSHKDIAAYKWALDNLEWDIMARINASCYVAKQRLFNKVQSLPTEGLFNGVGAKAPNGEMYLWGGCQFLISRDVIKKMVDRESEWNHGPTEDISMSVIAKKCGVELDTKGSV